MIPFTSSRNRFAFVIRLFRAGSRFGRRDLRPGEIRFDMTIDVAVDLESFDETICLHMLHDVESVLFVDIEETLRLEPSGVYLLAPLLWIVPAAQGISGLYMNTYNRHDVGDWKASIDMLRNKPCFSLYQQSSFPFHKNVIMPRRCTATCRPFHCPCAR